MLGKSKKGNKSQIFLLSDILTSVFSDSNIFLCGNCTLLQRRLLMVKSFPAGKEKYVPQITVMAKLSCCKTPFSQRSKVRHYSLYSFIRILGKCFVNLNLNLKILCYWYLKDTEIYWQKRNTHLYMSNPHSFLIKSGKTHCFHRLLTENSTGTCMNKIIE